MSNLCLYESTYFVFNTDDGVDVKHILYFSPSISSFSKQHIPYLITAIVSLVMFAFIPLCLLCLYPTRVLRKLLRCCLLSRLRQSLWIFVETFQGYYKDGSDGKRDFRALSGAHFIILLFISSGCSSDRIREGLLPVVQLILVSVSLLYAIARPCKEHSANIIQSLLLALTAFTLQLSYIATVHVQTYFTLFVLLLCLLTPHIALYGYAMYRIIKPIHRRLYYYCSISRPNNQVDVQHERDCDGQQCDEWTLLLNK